MQIVSGEDTYGTLRGWNLGILPSDKRRRAVFFPGKARCIVCQKGISDREWRLFQACSSWKCRTKQRGKQRALQKKNDGRDLRHRREFERRVSLLRHKAAGLMGIDSPGNYLPVVIPATQNPVTGYSKERLKLLKNHLKKIILEIQDYRSIAATDQEISARQEADQEVSINAGSNPHPIIREACAMCRGRCCINGKEHAYLSPKTIQRYAKRFPQLEDHRLCADFVSYVEEDAIDNSCIYHGKMGCSLPRDARSNTCNEFECPGLRRLQHKLSAAGPHKIFLVAAIKNRAIRYAFIKN